MQELERGAQHWDPGWTSSFSQEKAATSLLTIQESYEELMRQISAEIGARRQDRVGGAIGH